MKSSFITFLYLVDKKKRKMKKKKKTSLLYMSLELRLTDRSRVKKYKNDIGDKSPFLKVNKK